LAVVGFGSSLKACKVTKVNFYFHTEKRKITKARKGKRPFIAVLADA
jgi:hypothetical protein